MEVMKSDVQSDDAYVWLWVGCPVLANSEQTVVLFRNSVQIFHENPVDPQHNVKSQKGHDDKAVIRKSWLQQLPHLNSFVWKAMLDQFKFHVWGIEREFEHDEIMIIG